MPAPACPDCGAELVLRRGRFGPFFGCSAYPACRGSHSATTDGQLAGIPADSETRRLRRLVLQHMRRGSLDRAAMQKPIAQMSGQECQVALGEVDPLFEEPTAEERTLWDHLLESEA